MGEAVVSLVEWFKHRDAPLWTLPTVLAAGAAVAAKWCFELGKTAGRNQVLTWLRKNPAAGYQLLEEQRKQGLRDTDLLR